MEKLRNAKKSKVIIAIVASVLIIAGATMALLSQATQTANNNFAGAGVNVAVKEGDKVLENGSNINTYSKNISTGVEKSVKIENKYSVDYPTTDTYVRVRLVPIIRYNEGTEYAGQVANTNIDLTQLTFTGGSFNDAGKILGSSKWVAYTDLTSGETYYYYKEAIAAGSDTTELIRSVKYTGTIPKDTHFELQVLTEGIAANQHIDTDGNIKAYNLAWQDVTNTTALGTLVEVASNN